MTFHIRATCSAIVIILASGSSVIAQSQTPSCDWDNPKESELNEPFDGKSENWKDLVRIKLYDLYNIYPNYLKPGHYPAGTQHLIGLDFAGDNLTLLNDHYKATAAYAKAVCDRELYAIAGNKYFNILSARGQHSMALNFINSLSQKAISDADKVKLELYAKYKTVAKKETNNPLKLKNVARKRRLNRLTIKAKANGRNSRLVFDTGGDTVSYGYKFGKKAKFHITKLENRHSTSLGREYNGKISFINELSLGSISLENVHTDLTPFKPNEFWWDGKTKENFDGLLGIQEIMRLGERITFAVKNDRIDHIVIDDLPLDNTVIDEPRDIENKIFFGSHASKPLINMRIEDKSYACLWDTGGPVTIISKSIYEKHSDVITRKGFEQSDKVHGRLDQAVIAGKAVPHDIKFSERKDTWCVVGLNAIIAAGGAVWDVKNGRIDLGLPN